MRVLTTPIHCKFRLTPVRLMLLATTALAALPAQAEVVTSGSASPSINTTGDSAQSSVGIGFSGGTGTLTINNGSTLTTDGSGVLQPSPGSD